jgi:hypothetical protein
METTGNFDLHKTFVRLGHERNKITYKLLRLLPEIHRQRIYQQHGYATIYEYAGKLAGLSKNVVAKALCLERNLEGKPHLQGAIENAGVHKVSMVARLATAETDHAWADKVVNMSKPALQELVREVREKERMSISEAQGLFCDKSVESVQTDLCRTIPTSLKIEFDNEMQGLFFKLKQMQERESCLNLSNKEAMRRILRKFLNSTYNKTNLQKQVHGKFLPGEKFAEEGKIVSRYISASVRREVLKIFDGKCAYPGCGKPSEVFHHCERFAHKRSHESIVPLCRVHHEFAHNGIVQNECGKTDEWQFRLKNGVLNWADEAYRQKR